MYYRVTTHRDATTSVVELHNWYNGQYLRDAGIPLIQTVIVPRQESVALLALNSESEGPPIHGTPERQLSRAQELWVLHLVDLCLSHVLCVTAFTQAVEVYTYNPPFGVSRRMMLKLWADIQADPDFPDIASVELRLDIGGSFITAKWFTGNQQATLSSSFYRR